MRRLVQMAAWKKEHAPSLESQKTVVTYDKVKGVTAVKAEPGREAWSAKSLAQQKKEGRAGGRQTERSREKAKEKDKLRRKGSVQAKQKLGGRRLSSLSVEEVRNLGDAESSLGDAKSSLGDATSSLGDAESSLGG